MSESTAEASLEQCADEMNDFVASLANYPDTVLAFALRAQLSAMLQALQTAGVWSRAEVVGFLESFTNETLEEE